MRILVIPDLHEDLDFLKYIIAREDTATFDHVVLLGDYFDGRGELTPCLKRLERVAGTLVGLKEILGDKLHLLCGNHDLPYYALRPVCDENTGRPNRIISTWLEETNCERAEVINAVWDEAFWKELEVAVLLDGWLFSHAGVHPEWWNAAARSSEARARHLKWSWDEAFDQIFDEPEHPIFAAGVARGGVRPHGGPLWLDFDIEFEDALEVPQIVGHTSCARQMQKGRSFCIDLRQAAYGVLEDGDFELRILPKSWLGEAMLDGVES